VCSTLTIDEHGLELFEAVCGLDMEGIVAKRKSDPYDTRTRWLKIKNPSYSEPAGSERSEGRHEYARWGEVR
jgi:ATP-dependent DNA ligase